MALEADVFKMAMGRLAGAVTVLATSDDAGNRCGITATAVCSLTAEPPALVACVNKETWMGSMLVESGRFCVNVLSREQQDVAEVFAGMTGVSGADRFAHGRWSSAVTGAPVLEGSLASFDCRVDALVGRSSHWLVIGAVEGALLGAGAGVDPLLYVARRFAGVAP